MSARASNLFLRAGVVVIMAMFIGAPTPGYVSGCNTGGSAVDPGDYCRGYNLRACERDRVAGRIDDAGAQECFGRIDLMCTGFNFAVGCSPSVATVQACFDALVDPRRIGTDDLALPECQAVCGGSALVVDPEGI